MIRARGGMKKRLLSSLGRGTIRRSPVGRAHHRPQGLAQIGGGHVVVEPPQQRQAIGNRGHMLGGADSLQSCLILPFAKRFYGREDMVGLSTIRIAPEAFQHKHETMDTLAK